MIYDFRVGHSNASSPYAERPWQWDYLPELRERMSITLCGSYHPPSEMRLLEQRRDRLRSAGYVQAGLVKDGADDDDVGPLGASKRFLKHSDVNFLIFTKEGMRHGVIRELACVADAMIESKVEDCVVFDQVVDGRSSVPDLSMCDLRNAQIYRYEFSDEPGLREGLLMRAMQYPCGRYISERGRAARASTACPHGRHR